MSIVCQNDSSLDIMEQEQAFLAALQSAALLRLEAGQLFVNDINSVVLVEFVAY